MDSDKQSTVIIALAPGDDELINNIRTLLVEIGSPNWGFVVVEDSGGFEFGNIEWAVPHPITFFHPSNQSTVSSEIQRLNQEFLDKAILIPPAGMLASMGYHYQQQEENLLLAAKEFEATLPKVEIKLNEIKQALAKTETKPRKHGKKGRGFNDPRSRIIT